MDLYKNKLKYGDNFSWCKYNFKIIIKVTKNNIEKGISKGKQMQGIGQLLWKLREKEGIRQKQLCLGISSVSKYARIEAESAGN